MSSLISQRQSLTFRARTYVAFALAPQAPVADWLAALDTTLRQNKSFFAGHAVALDLSAVRLSPGGIAQLVAELEARQIRVLGIEGVDAAGASVRLPPLLRAGVVAPEMAQCEAVPADLPAQRHEAASLLIDYPVRSGQSVVFIEGDVTVVGSVGSGAEIIAGGSIHVYGTLRGAAMAGAAGSSRARIFCQRFDCELVAIGAYYRTADEIEADLRRGPAQAFLEGDTLKISALN